MIIKLLLILLTIDCVARLIFKPKDNILACGIFAWLGKDPKKFNRDKFDKLGIYNEARGTDSVGISIDGEIGVGIQGLSVYRDYIANRQYEDPKHVPAVIGHTRWGSQGGKTVYNAHPFGFGENKQGGFGFVGVHNGTLINHKDLAKDFKIDLVAETKDKVSRTKIDSEVLLEILYSSSNYKVLSAYDGTAALVFMNIDEPNVVYCYHGESKEFDYASAKPKEERPLFYYKENKNSLYVSSMKNSLQAIGGDDKSIGIFEHNTVYKITNGDIQGAHKVKISRNGRCQKSSSYKGSYSEGTQTNKKDTKKKADTTATAGTSNSRVGRTRSFPSRTNSDEINIYNDTVKNQNNYGGKIYFEKLRYFRNGHLIDGIYTYVKGFGLFYLAQDYKNASTNFYNYVNKVFVDNWFHDVEQAKKLGVFDKGFIPFNHENGNEITNPPMFFFYQGIRVKDWSDLRACRNYASNGRAFDVASLSYCSCHPVIDITCESRPTEDQEIFYEGELYTGNIAPLDSEKIYNIKDGNLISTKERQDVVKVIQLGCALDIIKESEEQMKMDFAKRDNKQEDFLSNDMVDDLIEKSFATGIDSFPRYKRNLQKFLPNVRAEKAIKIIDTFMTSTYKLITLEEKE